MARVALVVVLVAIAATLASRPSAAVPTAPPAPRDNGRSLTFDPAVGPYDRALVEQAVASARPEARRLIEAVDGLITVRVGVPAGRALGTAQPLGDGRYELVLDITQALHGTGRRGVMRMVLHELGHVIDFRLVPHSLAAELDAGVPRGVPCPAGTQLGACAPRAERFAETFAKWAMFNDLGVNLYSGYAVPPPTMGFDAWAAPLVELLPR